MFFFLTQNECFSTFGSDNSLGWTTEKLRKLEKLKMKKNFITFLVFSFDFSYLIESSHTDDIRTTYDYVMALYETL